MREWHYTWPWSWCVRHIRISRNVNGHSHSPPTTVAVDTMNGDDDEDETRRERWRSMSGYVCVWDCSTSNYIPNCYPKPWTLFRNTPALFTCAATYKHVSSRTMQLIHAHEHEHTHTKRMESNRLCPMNIGQLRIIADLNDEEATKTTTTPVK